MSTKMSKRIRCVVLALLLTAVSVGGMFGCGDDGQRLTFEPNRGGAVFDYYVVTGGRPNRNGHLAIPSHRHSIPVRAVGSRAFLSNNEIKSLFIPHTVTTLQNEAFSNATNLASIEFESESGLVQILNSAFVNSGLENIVIPKSVEIIGRWAFGGCRNLTTVEIESGSKLSRIESSAFRNCINLETINFPASLRYIGENAFRDAINLRLVKQEEGSELEHIDFAAFANTFALESFVLPHSVRILSGGFHFSGWTNLQTIYVQGRYSPPPATFAFAATPFLVARPKY